MESMGVILSSGKNMINQQFWIGKKVFLTGHTGFKGSWLSIWLTNLGANVKGYSLQPPTSPSLFEQCKLDRIVDTVIGDVRNAEMLSKTLVEFDPDIVIHMAAQPLVRDSYQNPVDTYSINVMGTVHLFEAIRKCSNVKAVVNVTTDKCYENKEWVWGYREYEPLGGYDPYSSSKACSELVTSSYRNSFFHPEQYHVHGVGVASARAGNVIGGGDWAKDRLIPDIIRSLLEEHPIVIRNPRAIRPWQHVLEPLSGYLILVQKLYENGPQYAEAWNFGPNDDDAKPVEWIVKRMCEKWGKGATYVIDKGVHPHEAHFLKLDCSKAKSRLDWMPSWSLDQALDKIIEWTYSYQAGDDLLSACLQQIGDYSKTKVR